MLQIATSSNTTAMMTVPNSSVPPTWYEWNNTYTWYSINAAGVTWNNQTAVEFSQIIQPSAGIYGRKLLKLGTKRRFRQTFFTITTAASATSSATDSAVKIYDLTVFLSHKEHVVKETT
jgi:hypothetical protein